MNSGPTYHFDRPPLRETVLGVQFDQLQKLKVAHLGAFWKHLGSEWPSALDAPEIDFQFEQFDGSFPQASFEFRLSKVAPVRLQIKNRAGDRMIQVQNGRLHYNWLHKGQADYPHYEQVRAEFLKALESFKVFIAQEQCGAMRFNQWEVTYVNHIPKGDLWSESADLSKLFKFEASPSLLNANMSLESFASEWHFRLPDQRGRLHVQLKHGMSEKKLALLMNLTARGSLLSAEDEKGLTEGLDLGRSAIGTAFTALTSDLAHKYWGRTS